MSKSSTPKGINIRCMECGSHLYPDGTCPKCKTQNIKFSGNAKMTFKDGEATFES